MRKFFIIIVVLAAIVLGYLGYAHFSGGAVPTFGLAIGGEKAKIRALTLAFFEQVKFKNSNVLTNFVASDADLSEISAYLTRTLGMDVDGLDLDKIMIKHIELDSLGTRARVKIVITGHNLVTRKPLEIEKIIFLYNVGDKWLVDIKNLAS